MCNKVPAKKRKKLNQSSACYLTLVIQVQVGLTRVRRGQVIVCPWIATRILTKLVRSDLQTKTEQKIESHPVNLIVGGCYNCTITHGFITIFYLFLPLSTSQDYPIWAGVRGTHTMKILSPHVKIWMDNPAPTENFNSNWDGFPKLELEYLTSLGG